MSTLPQLQNDNMPARLRLQAPRSPSDEVDFHLSFSPSDCHAFVMLPIFQGDRIVSRITERMGEVLMFSLSSHRDKFPVSRLGRMLPVGFTAGRRTVAGTIGLAVWDRNALRRLSKRLYQAFPQFIGTPHADEFPPLDILLVFVNEAGSSVSITLYGVTFLDEGTTLNTEDVRAFTTLSYMAVDYEINTDPLAPKREEGSAVPQTTPAPKVSLPKELQVNLFRVVPGAQRPSEMALQLSRPMGQRISVPQEVYSLNVEMNLYGEFVDRPLLPLEMLPR